MASNLRTNYSFSPIILKYSFTNTEERAIISLFLPFSQSLQKDVIILHIFQINIYDIQYDKISTHGFIKSVILIGEVHVDWGGERPRK